MAVIFSLGDYNIALNGAYDKMGDAVRLFVLALVAKGRWRVMGSSNGSSTFQLRGQTAGVGGLMPFWVLTGAAAGNAAGWTTGATTSSISNLRAWVIMEEIDALGNPTGRAFGLKRYHLDGNAGFGGAWAGVFTTAGFATSGASATTPPAVNVVGQSFWMWGSTSFADGATNNWIVQDSSVGGSNPAFQSMNGNTTNQNWVHIAVDTAPPASNVCGFQFTSFSRSLGISGLAFVYRPLAKAAANDPHPFWLAAGNWGNCFGQLGSNSLGPIWGSVQSRYGINLVQASLYRQGGAVFGSAGYPGTVFSTARLDNTVLSRKIELATASGSIGLVDRTWMNVYNRDYPTSYGVAGLTPRVTFGQLVVDSPGTALNSSP